jgi:hypothetical protein
MGLQVARTIVPPYPYILSPPPSVQLASASTHQFGTKLIALARNSEMHFKKKRNMVLEPSLL